MALRIGSNIPSLTAQRYLAQNQKQIETSYRALASGSRLSGPQNDAAGFAISETLHSQVASLGQAKRNAENAQAMIQTAEGALNEQNNILVRMRELAVNAASDTIGNKERVYVNDEFSQLLAEFDRIAKTTQFGSKKLLSGTEKNFSFQVGSNEGPENEIRFKLNSDTRASAVGIDGLDVLEKSDARDALSSIDDALEKLAGTRAKLGAVQSRFNYAIDNLDVQKENVESARSVVADVDVAAEASRLVRAQILNQAGISVLAQANSYPKTLLRLLD